jgi:hypothetical protein
MKLSHSSKKTRSLGEMISTFCFFGMSAWLALEGLALIGTVPDWQLWGLFLSSFCCFLGGLRFVIVELVRVALRLAGK